MRRLVPAILLALLLTPLTAACFFRGGGSDTPSVQRPSSIPTATPPATLPEPIVVGETQAGTTGSTSGAPGENTYVVKSGDTLGSIATSLGIPPAQQATWVQEVLRINGIPDATLLQAGVALTLPRVQITPTPRPTGTVAGQPTTAARTPTPGATQPAATAAASATPRPTVVSGGSTYTVVSGDFPLLIAQKLGVPQAQQAAWADQLVALNGIDPSALQVGQVLQLPPIPAAAATATPSG